MTFEEDENTMTATTLEKPVGERQTELDKIKELAELIDAKRAEVHELQEELDQTVRTARDNRVRFREIANAAGRSISWVQASLVREPTPKATAA